MSQLRRMRDLASVRKHPPDLVVLDRPQADMEGVRLLQQLHDTAEQVPVLLVGRDPTPADQVRWLDSGADDCVGLTLPFEVVLARARALLRRPPAPQRLTYADLVIDAAAYYDIS
jgi:DNA-binding response OmpR family regulator